MEKCPRPHPKEPLAWRDPAGSPQGEMHIPKGGVASLDAAFRGYRVICRSGLIWLTQENDAEDYLIGGGASFDADRPGRIVLEALQDSVVRIVRCAATGRLAYAGRIQPHCRPQCRKGGYERYAFRDETVKAHS